MTKHADPQPLEGEALGTRRATDLATLDRELTEIDMLVGQARTESARHEQKRLQAADKLSEAKDPAEAYTQALLLTRRAALMEAQVDILDGKRRALARHRDAIAAIVDQVGGIDITIVDPGVGPGLAAAAGADLPEIAETLPPTLSRVVLNAQEDLRREIARAMHDGPAQSLTNITLQAQIVERLLDRDLGMAKGELRLLVQMVQQTLEATKNFIFDVRPMVLDDLGLVPTLRRATRERGRRAGIPVEFDSIGADHRIEVDLESSLFRIVDEALGAYLAQNPDKVVVRLDWSDGVLDVE